jgi:hypothetical protein
MLGRSKHLSNLLAQLGDLGLELATLHVSSQCRGDLRDGPRCTLEVSISRLGREAAHALGTCIYHPLRRAVEFGQIQRRGFFGLWDPGAAVFA